MEQLNADQSECRGRNPQAEAATRRGHWNYRGSATLVQSLMEADLIEEHRVLVHSVVVGSGKRLFKDGMDTTALKLVQARTFSLGVVGLTYQPARRGREN